MFLLSYFCSKEQFFDIALVFQKRYTYWCLQKVFQFFWICKKTLLKSSSNKSPLTFSASACIPEGPNTLSASAYASFGILKRKINSYCKKYLTFLCHILNMTESVRLTKRNSTFSWSVPLMVAWNPRLPLSDCVVAVAVVVGCVEENAAVGIWN